MLGGEEALVSAICKEMEKVNGVVDPSEVGGDVYPPAEGAPMLTIGGVLLVDRGINPWKKSCRAALKLTATFTCMVGEVDAIVSSSGSVGVSGQGSCCR